MKKKKKTLYMYKYVQMPTQVLKQTHACARTHKYTQTHTPACCHFGFCAYTGVVLCDRASSGSKKRTRRRGEERGIQDNLHASFLRK